jgi:hypothetical protein
MKVEHSTFPNWMGTDQKRTIAITGNDLKWTNPAGSAGGVLNWYLSEPQHGSNSGPTLKRPHSASARWGFSLPMSLPDGRLFDDPVSASPRSVAHL